MAMAVAASAHLAAQLASAPPRSLHLGSQGRLAVTPLRIIPSTSATRGPQPRTKLRSVVPVVAAATVDTTTPASAPPKPGPPLSFGELTGISDNWATCLNPLHPDLKRKIITLGEMVEVAYEGFTFEAWSRYHGQCVWDQDFLIEGLTANLGLFTELQKTDYTASAQKGGAFLYCPADAKTMESIRENLTNTTGYGVPQADFLGYVAVSEKNKDIAVVFRGTQTNQEVLKDLTYTKTTFESYSKKYKGEKPLQTAKVHDGFHEIYTKQTQKGLSLQKSVHETVAALLKTKKYESISVTGHSLGGAIAVLAAFDLVTSGTSTIDGKKVPVTAITFAGPRAGDESFASAFEALAGDNLRLLRVQNRRDVVPNVPKDYGLNVPFIAATFAGTKASGKVTVPLADIGISAINAAERILPFGNFTHPGQELTLDSHNCYYYKKDILAYHSHNGYLHLVDGFQSKDAPFKDLTRDFALVNKDSDALRPEMGVPPSWRKLLPFTPIPGVSKAVQDRVREVGVKVNKHGAVIEAYSKGEDENHKGDEMQVPGTMQWKGKLVPCHEINRNLFQEVRKTV